MINRRTEFISSINHLKQQNLILVAGGHTTETEKVSINLFTDTMPFEKVQTLSVEREDYRVLIVADDMRKDQNNVIMALATLNPEHKPAKLVKLETNESKKWTLTTQEVFDYDQIPDDETDKLLNCLITDDNLIILVFE